LLVKNIAEAGFVRTFALSEELLNIAIEVIMTSFAISPAIKADDNPQLLKPSGINKGDIILPKLSRILPLPFSTYLKVKEKFVSN